MKDPIVERIREEFEQRSTAGIRKYGKTLARTDLELLDWLQHFKEELMDAVLYTEASMESIRIRREQEERKQAG